MKPKINVSNGRKFHQLQSRMVWKKYLNASQLLKPKNNPVLIYAG